MEISKEAALTELCSFFIDILAFELGKLCLEGGRGGGILFSFLNPAGGLH